MDLFLAGFDFFEKLLASLPGPEELLLPASLLVTFPVPTNSSPCLPLLGFFIVLISLFASFMTSLAQRRHAWILSGFKGLHFFAYPADPHLSNPLN